MARKTTDKPPEPAPRAHGMQVRINGEVLGRAARMAGLRGVTVGEYVTRATEAAIARDVDELKTGGLDVFLPKAEAPKGRKASK